MIKSDELLGFVPFCASLGIAGEAELDRVGLLHSAASPPGNYIRFATFSRLLEGTAQTAECPTLGLQFALYRGHRYIEGPLTLALRQAPTLGEAVRLGVQFDHVYSSAIQLRQADAWNQSGCVDLLIERTSGHEAKGVQAMEFVVGCVVQLLQWLSDDSIAPVAVHFSHAGLGKDEEYRSAFHAETRFNQPCTAIRFSQADLARPLPHSNPVLFEMALRYMESTYGNSHAVFSDRVRSLVRQRIAQEPLTMVGIAAHMSMHVKSLQRRLAKEQVAFDDLVDGVRKDRFLELIARTERLTFSEIAGLLGYSEQAALSRSCKRWFGCAPTDLVRQRAQAAY